MFETTKHKSTSAWLPAGAGANAAGPMRSPAFRSNQTAQRSLALAERIIGRSAGRPLPEGDRLSGAVSGAPEVSKESGVFALQRKCAHCEEAAVRDLGAAPKIHRKAAFANPAGPQPEGAIRGVLNAGRRLPSATRDFFESRLGRDFSPVRLHTGTEAGESARNLNARAYTYGQNIVFASGEFAPETSMGRRLLAHELVHTVQQRATDKAPGIQRTMGDGHDLEAARFKGNAKLEAAYDNELLIDKGAHGDHVRLLQQSLLDMGYTLPGFGADGDFGSETKAAIKMFQADAHARMIDGVVGPETMTLFDKHDTTRKGGDGPPQRLGPVPGPLPPPKATCATPFAGVNFTITHQKASGSSPAGQIVVRKGVARPIDTLFLNGLIFKLDYSPENSINAPDDAKAREFQVGFVSNLLDERVEYFYSSGVSITSTLPTPLKDGKPLSSGHYDPVFVETPAASVLENFTANGDARDLDWSDTPSDNTRIDIEQNPECAAQPPGAKLLTGAFIDSFRTWVVVRHRQSGCTQALHHIDWTLDLEALVTYPKGGPTAVPAQNVVTATEPDGDGSPPFIQGGKVPEDLLSSSKTSRSCA
jgi:hypothetical protein